MLFGLLTLAPLYASASSPPLASLHSQAHPQQIQQQQEKNISIFQTAAATIAAVPLQLFRCQGDDVMMSRFGSSTAKESANNCKSRESGSADATATRPQKSTTPFLSCSGRLVMVFHCCFEALLVVRAMKQATSVFSERMALSFPSMGVLSHRWTKETSN